MPRIFINYRRVDSEAYADRLYDLLVSHFGPGHVFMDIDDILPGDDFTEVIHRQLASVDVFIVLIGRHWVDIKDDSGQRRLNNPNDFVRNEIVFALERNIKIIPVLMSDAKMPTSLQLPDSINRLVKLNALEISRRHFPSDTIKLIKAIEIQMGSKNQSSKWIFYISVFILIVITLLLLSINDGWKADELLKSNDKHIILFEEKEESKEGNIQIPNSSEQPKQKIEDHSFSIGDDVLAIWHKNNCYYPARVLKTGAEYFLIQYENIDEEAELIKNELFLISRPPEFTRGSEVFIYLDNADQGLWAPGIITEIKSSKKPEYRVEPTNDTKCNTYWDRNHQYVTREKLILRESKGEQQ